MFLSFVLQDITYIYNGNIYINLSIYYRAILSSDLLVFYMIIYYIYFHLGNNQI
jgi:hypothetical protein